MSNKKILNIVLNRVEGDLELKVEIEDNVVTNAYSSGTMFRGFENMLIGRAALDSLVITPRICGICTSAHLYAAAKALDMVTGVSPPVNAIIVRNLTMIAEHLQSDIRHCFLMFMVDFTNQHYKDYSFFDEAQKRYLPVKGTSALSVIKQTRKLPEVISILGGQWPHSAHIVPGGVSTIPSKSDLLLCQSLFNNFKYWYEKQVLGCSIERWNEVNSYHELEKWLNESDNHLNSELGFFLQIAKQTGLDTFGSGHDNFLCFGGLELPENNKLSESFFPSGFMNKSNLEMFDQQNITEHVAYAKFADYEGGRHPLAGETIPLGPDADPKKYSWCKAPRYNDLPAETGPLAEMLIAGHPLITDIYQQNGTTVMLRQLARLLRPVALLKVAANWTKKIDNDGSFVNHTGSIEEGEGYGLIHASRGALGHWVKIENNQIKHYQIITPTSWNASPRDSSSVRGPWEEALVGVKIQDPDNPVELGHVIRSFDACLVCSVHTVTSSSSNQVEKKRDYCFSC